MDTNSSAVSMSARRGFLKHSAIGTVALAQLLAGRSPSSAADQEPHFKPLAKRVIYLFQSGGPSQLELMDFKPKLKDLHGSELPESIRNGQRLTGMTSGQKSFPVVAPKFKFQQYGSNGAWFS